MATKYSQIQPNAVFETTSGTFRKVDDLWFSDITGDFESMWSPIFDTTIITNEATEEVAAVEGEPKFITDPQSRITKPNPKYGKVAEASEVDNLAEKEFGKMWGSAEFDCGPDEYDYMAFCSINAVGAMKALGEVVGLNGSYIIMMPAIVDTLTVAYEEYQKNHADPEGDSFKAVVKKAKAAKKSPAKKVAKKAAKKVVKKAPAKRKRK